MGFPKSFSIYGLGVFSGSALTFGYKFFFDSTKPEITTPILVKETKAGSAEYFGTPESYLPNKHWDKNWDRRQHFYERQRQPTKTEGQGANEQKTEEAPRSSATRHIFLIRHGQYNLEGKVDSERFLTALGLQQAHITGNRLAELNLPLTSIISSTMTRALQTCEAIRTHLPEGLTHHPPDSLLTEGSPYPPEPRNSWSPELRYHVDGARLEAAFRRYFHRADPSQTEDSIEIIVCHANLIRYFVCRALQLPPEAWLRISLRHGSITWLAVRPNGRVSLRALSEAGHISPECLTTT